MSFLPNPLASRWGRLAAFFALYMTEGIPLGFTATAIATQMRRQGLGPEAIGAFVGWLYFPWALKWAVGPFVDVFSSERFGRRRVWILGTQLLMVATLLVAMPIDFVAGIQLFTWIILVHNACAATMDVAIDALACNVLKPEERGVANGMMFAGAYIGQAVGGSAVLYLTDVMPFKSTFFLVAASILAVTVFVALPMREPPGPPRAAGGLAHAGREVGRFVVEAWRSFTGSRAALLGVAFALLPAGAYALGLALQSNLAVELGFDDSAVAKLNLYSAVISAVGCVAGGWLSDRIGRRLTLGIWIAAMSIPTVWLAQSLQAHGWILPVALDAPDRPAVPADLVTVFWITVLVYNLFNGLMYGVRSALFMDVTNPLVAATQFTAYMAMLNFAISYSARWQGWAAEHWGYPKTLLADAAFGLVCLILLPLIRPGKKGAAPAGTPEMIGPAAGTKVVD